MTLPAERFPYVISDPAMGAATQMPYLPITLSLGAVSLPVSGLLDSGALINVLPHSVGLRLGAVWEQQTTPVRLGGNLAGAEARVMILAANVGKFPPVRLAFAWAPTDGMPVLLGQMNFFQEFDICFFRSRPVFEVRPK